MPAPAPNLERAAETTRLAPAAQRERTIVPEVATAAAAQPEPRAATSVPRPAPAASAPPEIAAPAPASSRLRLPLIVAGVLVLLALGSLAIFAAGRSGSGAASPTSGASPTSAAAAATAAPIQPTEAAQQPTAQLPAPAGTLVFEDDFGAGPEKSGLIARQPPPDLALAVDPPGVYAMKLSKPNQARWMLLPRVAVGDFSLQIDLSDGSADFNGGTAQGVIFRARDNDHFYALLIDPRGGQYRVRKLAGRDTWTDLLPAKASALIQKRDAPNQLRLDAAGDTFTIYLNGAQVDSFRDGDYAAGMVGTIVANEDAPATTMRFDNLKVWSNDPPPQASNLPVTRPALSGDMALIRGGEFIMGSNDDPNHLPHIVRQPDFYIDSKEVTNIAYLTCADSAGCDLPRSLDSATHKDYVTTQEFNFYPVLDVTWQQAHAFCALNDKHLPTEAEWEKAASWSARARTKSVWPWGDTFDPTRLNSAESKQPDTLAVGTFSPEQNGTFDMAGNVAEWTSTLDKPYPYDPADGREDAQASGNRVVRGGSWKQPQEASIASARQAVAPTTSNNAIGFRCAATP